MHMPTYDHAHTQAMRLQRAVQGGVKQPCYCGPGSQDGGRPVDSAVKRKEGEAQAAHHFISDRKVPGDISVSAERRRQFSFEQALERLRRGGCWR